MISKAQARDVLLSPDVQQILRAVYSTGAERLGVSQSLLSGVVCGDAAALVATTMISSLFAL